MAIFRFMYKYLKTPRPEIIQNRWSVTPWATQITGDSDFILTNNQCIAINIQVGY